MLFDAWYVYVLVYFGIFFSPIFTLACILFAFGHWIMGLCALVAAFIHGCR